MEKPLKQQLLETLEDLGEEQLKRFQWYLQNPELLNGFPNIKKYRLENADRLKTVDLMIDTHTSTNAMEVANMILKKIKMNEGQSWEEKM